MPTEPPARASCPLTENGLVRILSNPAHAEKAFQAADIAGRFAELREVGGHVFWPDDISMPQSLTAASFHKGGEHALLETG